jgi:hypothetical protein
MRKQTAQPMPAGGGFDPRDVAPRLQRQSVSGAFYLDAEINTEWELTLVGNLTLYLRNMKPGRRVFVTLIQDSTGSRTLTMGTTVLPSGGTAITLTTTANKADHLVFRARGNGTSIDVWSSLNH